VSPYTLKTLLLLSADDDDDDYDNDGDQSINQSFSTQLK